MYSIEERERALIATMYTALHYADTAFCFLAQYNTGYSFDPCHDLQLLASFPGPQLPALQF